MVKKYLNLARETVLKAWVLLKPWLLRQRVEVYAYVLGLSLLGVSGFFFIDDLRQHLGSQVSLYYWDEFKGQFSTEKRNFKFSLLESKSERVKRLLGIWLLGPNGLHLQKKGKASLVLLGLSIDGAKLILDFDTSLLEIWNDGDIKLFLEGLAQTVSNDQPQLKQLQILCEGQNIPHVSAELDLGSVLLLNSLTLKGAQKKE